MKPVLLDTGAIVALLDRSEQHHSRCAEALKGLTGQLVTCEAVIAESCYLLRDVSGGSDAVLENVERGFFRLPFRLDESSRSVRTLMKRYARVPMDLADASLVAAAEARRVNTVFTIDSDFFTYQMRDGQPFDVRPGP